MSTAVPMYGFGGAGGAVLNFEVIGGTSQPGSAKENTIWINTDKINNYYFSATQPENVTDYDVWISTGTSSSIEFNALKKNGIQVYPISAKQYVNGAWVDVDAMSYQDGEWVDWAVYLFKSGKGTIVGITGTEGINAKYSYDADKITMTMTAQASGDTCWLFFEDKQYIEAGKILIFDARCTSQHANSPTTWGRRFGVYTSIITNVSTTPATNSVATVLSEADSIRKEYKIPIETSGYYYVGTGGAGACEIYNVSIK